MERWSLNQAPTWTVPPLAIANRHYDTNNQLVQNTRYRLILTKASNLDWLTRDKHAMRDLTAQLPKKARTIGYLCKTCPSTK